jgi:hypothetical protein
MLTHFHEAFFSLLLAVLATCSGSQYGGRKLTYIMVEATHTLRLQYG